MKDSKKEFKKILKVINSQIWYFKNCYFSNSSKNAYEVSSQIIYDQLEELKDLNNHLIKLTQKDFKND